jgi:SAM-dependent methyltransferase
MPGTTYDVFALVYDAWQAGFSKPFSETVFPYYEEEILFRGVPTKSLVDLACGTGTFLGQWRSRHPDWRLLGTDSSSGMLQVARKKLGRGAGVTLLHQELQETRLPEVVGAAVCVFDSLNHLTSLDDLRQSFLRIACNLAPGGLFLFDLNDEASFASLFEGSWTVESKYLHATITASHTPAGDYGALQFTVFSPTGRLWRRHDFTVRERNWRSPDVRSALDEAGFLVHRVRRIHPYSPQEVEAPRTLWICRRKAGQGSLRARSSAGAPIDRSRKIIEKEMT